VVITGGLATRFSPVSSIIPKALLPVGTRPVIDYVLDNLRPLKIENTWLLVNSYSSLFQSWAKANDVKVHLTPVGDSVELGGVAADLYDLAEYIGFQTVMLIWGNMIYSGDVAEFLKHYCGKPLIGMLDIGDLEKVKRYGVGVVRDNRLVEYAEKPEHPKSTLTYMGLAVFPPYVLKLIPMFLQYVGHTHHRFGEFLNWLVEVKGLDVHTVTVDGNWQYMDWPDSYNEMWRSYLAHSNNTHEK
jgi:glucose-1-phosphate thymidylyltransferase